MEIINKVFTSSFIGTFIQRLCLWSVDKQQYTIEAMYRLGYITKTLKVKWRTVMYTHACLPIISEVCYHACLFIILEVHLLTCMSYICTHNFICKSHLWMLEVLPCAE